MATDNSFVTSNIFHIYEEVVRKSLSYCVLCLRSEKERKLVAPKSLTIFLNSLSNAQSFRNIKVCFVCEAHALSAVKFITAVKFALSVDQLLHDIEINKHRNLKRDLNLRLNGLSKLEYPALTLAVECEAQYRSARARAHLSTTEVLLVSSQRVADGAPSAARDKRSTDISKDIETVVLDDDDEATSGPPKPMTLIQTTQVAQMQVQPGLNALIPNQTNQLILHPLVQSADGKFYIPSLQNTTATSGTGLAYVTNEQLEAISNAGHAGVGDVSTPVMPAIQALLENNCSNSTSKYTVKVVDVEDSILPDVSSSKRPNSNNATKKIDTIAKSNFRDKVETENADEMQKTNKRWNTNEADVNSKKKCVETTISHAMAEKNSISVPVKVSNGNIILNDSAPAKGPIADPKRIDWEDKIPMDVISFMYDYIHLLKQDRNL